MKKYLCIFVTMLTLISVTGCQLAKEENVVRKEDVFVGILATYMEDGDEHKGIKDDEGKIYAELVESTDENGYKTHEYVFDVENSMPLFTPTFSTADADGEYEYISTMMSDKMHNIDVNNNVNYIEGAESHVTNTHQADIYFKSNVIMYVYSVYQKEDGSVYAVNENMGTHISGAGIMKEEYKKTSGNNTAVCILSASVKAEPKSVEIISMSKDNKVVKSDSYDVSQIPTSYKLDKEVEYIIVKSTDVENKIETKVCTPEDVFVDLAIVDDTAVLGRISVELEWADNGN